MTLTRGPSSSLLERRCEQARAKGWSEVLAELLDGGQRRGAARKKKKEETYQRPPDDNEK